MEMKHVYLQYRDDHEKCRFEFIILISVKYL